MNSRLKGVLCGVGAAVSYGMNPLGALPLYADGINTTTNSGSVGCFVRPIVIDFVCQFSFYGCRSGKYAPVCLPCHGGNYYGYFF